MMSPSKARRARRGQLYVLEGPDGIGKTTLARGLADALQKAGRPCAYLAFPGGERATLGELVYRVQHEAASLGIDRLTPTAMQILHVAAHADVIESRIRPLLARGHSVVLDRYWWSTWVYGLAGGVRRDLLIALVEVESRCWAEITPRAVFLLDRTHPWRPDERGERWSGLRRAYRRLAQRQFSKARTIAVNNDQPLSEMIHLLANHLTQSKACRLSTMRLRRKSY